MYRIGLDEPAGRCTARAHHTVVNAVIDMGEICLSRPRIAVGQMRLVHAVGLFGQPPTVKPPVVAIARNQRFVMFQYRSAAIKVRICA
jgi:hypothetical protein